MVILVEIVNEGQGVTVLHISLAKFDWSKNDLCLLAHGVLSSGQK